MWLLGKVKQDPLHLYEHFHIVSVIILDFLCLRSQMLCCCTDLPGKMFLMGLLVMELLRSNYLLIGF